MYRIRNTQPLPFNRNRFRANPLVKIFDLDSRYGLSSFTEGADITYWIDQVSGLQINESGPGEVLYVTNDVTINNLPSLNFSTVGGGHAFDLAVADVKKQFDRNGIMTVVAKRVTGGQNILISSSTAANSASACYLRYNPISTCTTSSNNEVILNSNIVDSDWHIVSVSKTKLYVDGVFMDGINNEIDGNGQYCGIGTIGRRTNVTNQFGGYLARVMIHSVSTPMHPHFINIYEELSELYNL